MFAKVFAKEEKFIFAFFALLTLEMPQEGIESRPTIQV
jgi:hypothetical protein